jgi:hypothetical protein
MDLCKSDYPTLADQLRTWLGDSQLRDVALRTARDLLGHAFESKNETVADRLYPALESDAKAMGVDVAGVLKRDPDKIARCIELLDEIRLPRERLDYNEIGKNWQKFPSLREFLGDRWLNEKDENNKTHQILYNLAYLSREAELEELRSQPPQKLEPLAALLRSLWFRELLRPRAMLTYLDEMAARIKELPGTRNLKEGLRSDDRFSETFSELQTAHAFAEAGHPIVLGPPAGAGKLDLQVTLDSVPVLMEVITPDLFRALKYSGRAIGVPNRARDKIYSEFKEHLAELPKDTKTPVVIVIDIGRSEIDYDFVADYLYGTLQFTFWTDKKTGKLVQSAWTRAEDSMHKLGEASSEKLDIISAVVCYKTPLGDDGKFHMQGQIFLNRHAQNPLTDAQVSKIEEALFH